MYSLKCRTCSKPFTTSNRTRKFCSKACKFLGQKKHRVFICPACGKNYKPRYARQKYCSWACRAKGRMKRIPLKTCPNCHKQFRCSKSKTRIYCSKKCYGEFTRKQLFRPCEYCGTVFHARPNDMRFCSPSCFSKSQRSARDNKCLRCGNVIENHNGLYCDTNCRRLPKITCLQCHKKFKPRSSTMKYCSANCFHIAKRGPNYGNSNTAIYGVKWREISSRIRKRDNWTCQTCRDFYKGNDPYYVMHVHHKQSVHDFNGDLEHANHPSNLITLCRDCHSKVEHGKLVLLNY